jgi:predicted MFS family arabinose efflux permease
MRLSRTAAFYLQASIIVSFLAGSSAPTAIYALYQRAWGFSPITVTVVFGTYALAVLATLLVAGSLSDFVGRRPVLLAAALVQAATMLLFASAHGVESLLAARVLQGIGTGMAAGAVGAGMLDIDRERGTVANAVGPMVGVATGALASGLFVGFLPAPTKLLYAVLGAVFVAQATGVALMPETVTARPGGLASLRPKLTVPSRLRPAFFVAVPALIATWALPGFYGSLGPTLVRRLVGANSPALAGLALFALASGGVTVVLLTRAWAPRRVLIAGTQGLVTGVALTLFAIGRGSVVLFFAGTAVAGGGFGAAFQGAVRSVVTLAQPHERASVLSVLYVVAYLSMGLPAVLGGVHLVHGGDIFATARGYGASVIVLAALALLGALRGRPADGEARLRVRALATARAVVRFR